MALDATQQARVDEINAALRDRKWRSGTERRALVDELWSLISSERGGAGAATTDPQDAARAAELVTALRGQLSAPDRAAISAELADILARDPHAAGAAPAAGTAAGTPPADPTVLASSPKITPKAIELSEQLRTGNLRRGSTERQQTLDALEAELLSADTAGAGDTAGAA